MLYMNHSVKKNWLICCTFPLVIGHKLNPVISLGWLGNAARLMEHRIDMTVWSQLWSQQTLTLDITSNSCDLRTHLGITMGLHGSKEIALDTRFFL